MELISWLNAQLEELGWTQRELSRRAGVSVAQVSRVLSGEGRAGVVFCAAIAGALGVEPWVTLKLAGYLPKSYEPRRDTLTQLLEAAASLPDEELAELTALARLKSRKSGGASAALLPKRGAA